MKKSIIIALMALCPISAMAQQEYTLKGSYTDKEGREWTVTENVVTKQRRTTSQGDRNAHLDYSNTNMPEFLSVGIAESLMARYPDYRTAYWKDYTYVQGYLFDAIFRLYDLTKDERYLNYVKTYMDNFVSAEGRYLGGELNNLDNFMTGSAFCSLYHYTNDEKYRKAALEILSHVDSYPSSDGQFWHNMRKNSMWVDGVFMMQMFLIRCAQYVGDADHCIEVSCRNIKAAAKHLQREDGLMLHAWTLTEETWADENGLAPTTWSEGMGWYALVIAELLEQLPKSHPDYKEILAIYTKMVAGLKAVQDPRTGGWYMVIDKTQHPLNFIDPSGTGMFLYSIEKGIRLGLISRKEYQPVTRRAYECLWPFINVNSQGLLDVLGGCDGVGVKENDLIYMTLTKIVNAKEAVGGVLWGSLIMEQDSIRK